MDAWERAAYMLVNCPHASITSYGARVASQHCPILRAGGRKISQEEIFSTKKKTTRPSVPLEEGGFQLKKCSLKNVKISLDMGSTSESLYVGDGHWDFRATQKLGIGFIGYGNKADKLRELGVRYILDRFDIEDFWNTVKKVHPGQNNSNPAFFAAGQMDWHG